MLATLSVKDRQALFNTSLEFGSGHAEMDLRVSFADAIGYSQERMCKEFPFLRRHLNIIALADFDGSGRKKILTRIRGGTPGQTLFMVDPYWIKVRQALEAEDADGERLASIKSGERICLDGFDSESCRITLRLKPGGGNEIIVRYATKIFDRVINNKKEYGYSRMTATLEYVGEKGFVICDQTDSWLPPTEHHQNDDEYEN